MRVCLIVYDNDSYVGTFPLGLAYVASNLRQQGHEVKIYPQDIYHWPEYHLTNYLEAEKPDVVAVGMCAGYYQYHKLLKIADAVNKCNPRPQFWIGGHLVSPAPEYFKEKTHADYICIGEYDYTEDIDSLPFPAWDLFNVDYYALMRLPRAENKDRCFPVLSGRGCPFHCNFCYRMYEGHRARSTDNIKEEIQWLHKGYGITYIDFADELLMISPQRTLEMCEMLAPLGIKWCCNGRLNYAKPDILKSMKETGCLFINYGIESVDDEVLKNMNKKLTFEQIEAGVSATLSAGISPGLNMLWGNIGDNIETLRKAVNFLIWHDDHAQLRTIRPVTPYPGCDLYYEAIKQGKLRDVADFYENKHVNSDLASVQFTNLNDAEFHHALLGANASLVRSYFDNKNLHLFMDMCKLYSRRDVSFRGFRPV